MCSYNFKLGDLVLMCNTAIEKALNQKMHARYLGPLIFISQNRGGACILTELDGSLLHRPIAAFRVIPYLARERIEIPSVEDLIDVSTAHLQELENTTKEDPEDLLDDEEEPCAYEDAD
jgi:hypothetical protein